jgi:hypothetical protein
MDKRVFVFLLLLAISVSVLACSGSVDLGQGSAIAPSDTPQPGPATDTPQPPATLPVPPPSGTAQPGPTAAIVMQVDNATVPANECFDLDAAVVIDCAAIEADFKFVVEQTVSTASWAIRPTYGSYFHELGIQYQSAEPPDWSLCHPGSFTQNDLDLLPMAESFWDCFRTAQQNHGWLIPNEWVPGTLRFDYAICNLP